MNKFFTIIIATMLACGICHGAKTTSAADVLAACATKIEKAPSFDIDLTMEIAGNSLPTKIILAGQKFYLDCAEMTIWYDGLTQWTLSKKSREVSITEPEADEIAMLNPFAIVTQPETAYNIRKLEGAKGSEYVELVPKTDDLGIRRAVLTVDPATSLPTELLIVLYNGQTAKIRVKKATQEKAKSPAFFQWDKDKAGAVRINDLR